MDRDGFVLLAGCWKSSKLVPSKVAYIEAFTPNEVKPAAPPADVEALVVKIEELTVRHEELMARNLALNAKVEVLDKIWAAEPSLCLEEAAATLHMPRHVLTRYLLVDGWAYCRAGREGLRGYAHTIKHGLLENVEHRARKMFGGERIVIEMRITRKGLTKLAAACQHSALLRNWMKPAAAE
jgi:phage antirepressor YoqD-like protein